MAIPAWLQAILDLLLLLLPGGSQARQVIVVAEDLIPVAEALRVWVLSPAGQQVVGDMEKLAKSANIDFSAAGVTQSAQDWKPPTGRISGGPDYPGAHGRLMPPGM